MSTAADRQWVIDLENENIDASRKLRQLLTTCIDPIETIKSFQERNSIRVSIFQLHLFSINQIPLVY